MSATSRQYRASLITVALGILLLPACQQDNKPVTTTAPRFFQASDFIQADYKKQRESRSLKKIVTINGQTDTLLIPDTLTETETVLLDKLNLNNPDWADKYTADTSYGVYGDADHYSYRSLDEKLPVQSIDVYLESGKVSSLKAVSRRHSLINHHDQVLTYVPRSGYHLVSTQKMWSGDTIRMEIRASFGN